MYIYIIMIRASHKMHRDAILLMKETKRFAKRFAAHKTGELIMNDSSYDITYTDLNPTLLFAGKTYSKSTRELHKHDRTEIICVLSGNEQFEIEGKIYDVSSGDIIIINPGVMHRTIVTNEADPALVFFTGLTNFHFRNMPPNSILLPDRTPILHTQSQLRQDIIGLCLDMVAERYSNQIGQYFMQKSYLIQILLLIIRQIITLPGELQKSCQFETYHKTYVVNEIRTYLNKHYNEKISLDLIAKNMYLSSAYISKIFKEETGEAPINYLIKLRLEKAKEQLESSNEKSVKTISTSVGYEDVYYFSKLFKKYYGMSPLNYKTRYQRV